MVNTELKKEDKNKGQTLIFCFGAKMKQTIKEIIPYIILIIIVILIKSYIISPIRVNGSSMYSTLHDKDIMILNKIIYHFKEIERFDIVVVDVPKSETIAKNEYIIKRIIGLPGDKIEYRNNILYVNGKKIKENFSHKKTTDFNIKDLGSLTVPKDHYFILGDNRTNSVDSRMLGFIQKKNIIGRAQYTILPFSRIGKRY